MSQLNKEHRIETNRENYDEDMSEFSKCDMTLYISKQQESKIKISSVNLDETIGYINILEERERPQTDKKKNLPYVLYTKRTNFQSAAQTVPNAVLPKSFAIGWNPFYDNNNPNNAKDPLQQQQQQDANSNDSLNQDNEHQIISNFVNELKSNLGNHDITSVIDPAMINNIQRKLSTDSMGKNSILGALGGGEQEVILIRKSLTENNNGMKRSHDDMVKLLEANKNLYMHGLPAAKGEDEIDEDVIYKLVNDTTVYSILDKAQILALANQKIDLSAKTDASRHPEANKSGGKECTDERIRTALRNTGKKIVKEIGKKIISGDFNLTTISFPIKCMIPRSALEKALASTCLFPFYVNKAAFSPDLIERFKLVICATLGQFYINLSFLKPLNPILGETCQGSYPDGTQLYAEQISHHPPISSFYVMGPNKKYKYWGNYNYESNAGLNSLNLRNRGSRHIQFEDGQHIEYNFAKEVYSGSFWGTMKVESMGKITFKDEKNKIEAYVNFDDVSGKPTDYFKGKIKKNGQDVCKILGTYMGFCEFDGMRYWDYRSIQPFKVKVEPSVLGSDTQYRKDKILLERGHINLAQQAKVELEELQRSDAKIRKAVKKQGK